MRDKAKGQTEVDVRRSPRRNRYGGARSGESASLLYTALLTLVRMSRLYSLAAAPVMCPVWLCCVPVSVREGNQLFIHKTV